MELLIINNFKIGNTKCKILEIAEEQYSHLLLNKEKLFKVYMVNCKMVLMVPYWGYFTGWMLEELQTKSLSKAFSKSNDRIYGYFCSDTVFNLSEKVLTDIEIKLLEKVLDYSPI